MSVHNHPPYRPMCNERDVAGQLRGACLNDDGTPRRPAMSHDHREAIAKVLAEHQAVATGLGEWACKCSPTEWRPTAYRSTHQADALLGSDVLAQIRAEARAEALRDAADELNTTDHATETALQGVDHAIWFLRDRAGGSA